MGDTEEPKSIVQKPSTQDERIILAIFPLSILIILGLVVSLVTGYWAWLVLCIVLGGIWIWLYIFQQERYEDYYTKVVPPAISLYKKVLRVSSPITKKVVTNMAQKSDKPTPEIAVNHPIAPITYRDIEAGKAYRQVLKITVPSSTPWDAEQAKRLMVALFGLFCPMNLIIRATEQQISWFIEIGGLGTTPLISAIQAVYPQAIIEPRPKTQIDTGYYCYQLEMAAPQIAPLADVLDLRKSDPLAGVVATMKNLNQGEELVYELVLGPTTQDYNQLAEYYLTKSDIKWADYLTTGGRSDIMAKQALKADRVQKFTPDIDKAVRVKVSSRLMEARFFVKFKTQDKNRAETILVEVGPSLHIFDATSLNFLDLAHPKSYPLLLTASEAAAMWHLPTKDIQTMGVEWRSGVLTPVPAPVVMATRNKTDDSLVLGTNTYQARTTEIRLPYSDRVTHASLIGGTRVGKSTLMHQMIHQDIENGKGVIVIDPHGDLVQAILNCSIPENRVNDVILFDVSDTDFPLGFNLLASESGIPAEKSASFVLGIMRKIFAESWSATRMEDVLYASIMSLYTYPKATVLDIPRLLTNPGFRSQVLKNVRDPVARGYWRDEFEPTSEGQKLQIVQPVNSRLRKFFRDPALRRIMCQTRSLDFRSIMDSNKIFLANMAGLGKIESETLGSLMFSKIYMAALSRANISEESRVPSYFYVDEVQNFVTTSLSEMLSQVGKYKLSLTTANQFFGQLDGDTLSAIIANVGTKVIFRVGEEDAPKLVNVVSPVATAKDLMELSRFHAVVKMQLDGQTLPAFSMMTLPPLPPKDSADDTTRDIRDNSRKTYGRPKEDIDREIDERYDDNEHPADDTDSDNRRDSDDGDYTG